MERYERLPSDVPELPDPWADLRHLLEEVRRTDPDATFSWHAGQPDQDESP